MMDDETLQMYIQEAKEHLEDIESNLLEIEQAGEEADHDLVNKVFRAAHSLKGGAGFLGLANIKNLAHKIENVLDMIRNKELVPSSEVINILLLAFDRLNELLEMPAESNELDISEHIQALQQITQKDAPDLQGEAWPENISVEHPQGKVEFSLSQADLAQATKGGKNLYIVEYDLIHDVHQKNKTPFDLIKLLSGSGNIVDLKVNLSSIGTLQNEPVTPSVPLFILYSSIIEADLAPKLLDIQDEKVNPLSFPQESENIQEESVRQSQDQDRQVVEEEPPGESKAAPENERQEQEDVSTSTASQETAAPKVKTRPESSKTSPLPDQNDSTSKPAFAQTETLRVQVSVLDQLMNLAGELVLSRNQLMQSLLFKDEHNMQLAGQRIDLVTSELQEAIMLTRMQPINNIFNKFPRMVRDLAQSLDKEFELKLEGKDVELDKAIIEGLGDPLTHLVRNAADHGLEKPEVREEKGKPRSGTILLKAYHESGQVNIEIKDDGQGMDPEIISEKAINKNLIDAEKVRTMSDKEKVNLIMLPGLSTVEDVSEYSGRGVGMDVVKSNLDALGGQVEIDSQLDIGTSIRIKLPLTLAIIPSLLVSVANEKFAIAQVNVSELLRLSQAQVRKRIEKVGDAEVLILRGELIPLLHLKDVLGLQKTFFDKKSGTFRPDRRSGLADDRLQEDKQETQDLSERRYQAQSDVNIVVVHAGVYKYGLVVDKLHDSVEIVVKPLGRHLKNCQAYAGATIMGDGHVALILDVPGLGRIAELSSMAGTERASELKSAEKEVRKTGSTIQSLLLFRNGPDEPCAVPLNLVGRVEQIRSSDIEIVGGKKVIQYRGGTLPVFALEEVANVGALEDSEELIVLVFEIWNQEVGLLAAPPVDALEVELVVDEKTLRQPGIWGSAIIKGQTTLLVDIYEFIQTLNPQWSKPKKQNLHSQKTDSSKQHSSSAYQSILLVEDSDFFRAQVKKMLEDNNYQVIEAEDGQIAWDYLQEHSESINIVVTDLEMPNMDGFELTEQIKNSQSCSHLPVIALTSLAATEDQEKGKKIGIDDYQIKLDKDKLLKSIAVHLQAS